MMRARGRDARRRVPFALALTAALCLACAGGMPKVPANPESILERADDLHRRGKNTQAAALYQAFIERYAGHERADYAQYQIGNCHFDLRDYSIAAVEYQVVITNFGYSEWVDESLFQIGVCYWRDAPNSARDQQKSVDALSRFSQFLQIYPDNARAPEARAYVRQINERLAEKAFASARWYQRQHAGQAAMIYCDKIIESYPENPIWVEALYMKGNILLARGENESAIAQYTRILEYPEDHPLKRSAQEKIRQARR